MNNIYPWQAKQWRQALTYVQANRLPSGVLLVGPKDIGKTTFTQVFAKRVLCSTQEEFSCGLCTSCQLMQSESHPDFIALQPAAEGKVISVDQVREVVASVNQTAQQSGWRVVIITPSEAMTVAAANALLKTLEEPPAKVLFLLVSHQSALLPATIRSRCQKIIFSVPTQEMSANWLQQQLSQSFWSKIPELLTLAEGLPLRALLWSEEQRFTARELVLDHFIRMNTGIISPTEAAAMGTPLELALIFDTLWSIFADLLRLKANPGGGLLTNSHQSHALKLISTKLSYEKLFECLDVMTEIMHYIQRNINLNVQLLLEKLYIAIIT